jgi:hypothetical protein
LPTPTTVCTALLRAGSDGRLTLTAYGEPFARDVRPPWSHPRSLERARTTITERYPKRRPELFTYPATSPPKAVQQQRNTQLTVFEFTRSLQGVGNSFG